MSGDHVVSKPLNPRKVQRILFGMLFVAVLVSATLAVRWVVLRDYDSWITGRRVSVAVQNARAVTLLEYVPGAILAKKEATPEELARLREATRLWYLPFVSADPLGCNESHHTIVVTDLSGAETSLDISFVCGRFGIPEEEIGGVLPRHLTKSLETFFASVGMKPRTWKEYSEIEKAARKIKSGEREP
jgi:hypothetical protein